MFVFNELRIYFPIRGSDRRHCCAEDHPGKNNFAPEFGRKGGTSTVFAENLTPGAPLPASLLMHGTQDPLVSHLQSQRLYSANFAQGGSPRLELQLLDEGHGGPMFNARIPRVVDFIGREIGIAPVPVPASLPMLIAGVGAFAALRRSRRA